MREKISTTSSNSMLDDCNVSRFPASANEDLVDNHYQLQLRNYPRHQFVRGNIATKTCLLDHSFLAPIYLVSYSYNRHDRHAGKFQFIHDYGLIPEAEPILFLCIGPPSHHHDADAAAAAITEHCPAYIFLSQSSRSCYAYYSAHMCASIQDVRVCVCWTGRVCLGGEHWHSECIVRHVTYASALSCHKITMRDDRWKSQIMRLDL